MLQYSGNSARLLSIHHRKYPEVDIQSLERRNCANSAAPGDECFHLSTASRMKHPAWRALSEEAVVVATMWDPVMTVISH
jgi:hypothetical protein